MTNYIKHDRFPQDDLDRRLLSVGWRFSGLSLFSHPQIRGHCNREQALKITEEQMLDVYCPACGSCGEEGCCPPEKCICFYREHYNKTYRELESEHERFLTLLRALTDTTGAYNKMDQIHDAAALLKELGYDTE